MCKIFGDFENAADLNECALNLLNNGELDDLKVLAEENNIPQSDVLRFIDRDISEICTAMNRKNDDKTLEEPTSAPFDTVPKEESPAETTVLPNETAAERLQREIKGAKNQHVPMVPIAKRLETLCESDPVLAAQILLPHKSLEKCFTYVQDKAFELLKGAGGRGWLDDEETYQIAVDYYNRDDAEEERKKEEARKKREEESKRRTAEAKKRNAERAAAAKNKPGGNATPATPGKPASTPVAKNAPPSGQMSLWGD